MFSFVLFSMHCICATSRSFAILLIALCAVSMPVIAQKSIENSADAKQVEQFERTRINIERTAAEKTLAERRKDCYQKLAATPCLNEARDVHREKTQDLKRQAVALSDVQRKRAAADRLKMIDQRNSPQAQLDEAQRRGNALASSKKRDVSQAQRKTDRDAKQRELIATLGVPGNGDASVAAAPAKPLPTGTPRKQPPLKLKPELRPGQDEKMAKSREQFKQREKAAEMRRAEAVQREAKQKKPAAAGLPIQD